MFTHQARKQIRDVLQKTKYGEDAFEFRDLTDEGQGSETFQIVFTLHRPFTYNLRLSSDNREQLPLRFWVSYAPGELLVGNEGGYWASFEDAVAGIPAWLSRIDTEILNRTPEVEKGLEELQQRFIQGLATHFGEGNDPFTESEKQTLYAKIDEFKQQLSDLLLRIDRTDANVAALKAEIDTLKATANLPKGMWARVAGSRLGRICFKFFQSREGRELLADGARRLLGFGDGG